MIDLTDRDVARLPLALADLHRTVAVGDRRRVRVDKHLAEPVRRDVTLGAGFGLVSGARGGVLTLVREWTLPDTVSSDMRLLVCGLNPSPAAADSGIAFHRPGNRFWPAALAAGLVSVDRDPVAALTVHGLGMTDIVKRTTRRADELEPDEYATGMARIDRLCRLLEPGVVCFVGLAGWRAAIDRSARPGWQAVALGGRPVYVMPSTSGLNAHSSLDSLTGHLRAAAEVGR